MIVLDATTNTVQVVLAGAVTTSQLNCFASWRDITTTAYTPGKTVTNTNNTTDVSMVSAPGASTQRVVDYLSVYNADTATATVTIKFDVAGTEYVLWKGPLSAGQKVEYSEGMGFRTLNANGAIVGIGTPGVDGAPGAPGAPGVGTTGTAVLDFGGYPGTSDASVDVTGQAGIVGTSVVEAWLRLEATGDHSADEHWVESLEVYAGNIVDGVGFTIYGKNVNPIAPMHRDAWMVSGRTTGPGIGINQVRKAPSVTAPRIVGQWNVQWRWS